MKPVSPALLALLDTRQYYKTTLYTFALVGGTTLRYVSADIDTVWDGNTFDSGGASGPYFQLAGDNSRAHWKVGLDVDTFQIGCAPGDATIGGVSFFNAIKIGLFDGADITVERAYAATPGGTIVGTITIFNGCMVGADPAGAGKFTLSVNSWTERLNMNWPRNLYQANCINTLGDTACGVNLSALGINGSVLNGSTMNSILTNLSQLTDYFTGGKIAFTSGPNNGFSRGVRKYTNGPTSTITLLGPVPTAPSVGTTFTIYPGCDKTIGTCFSRFNNLANNRSQPFVPENASAI